jgi:thiol:disulfide interchange protein DsbA
MNPLRRTLVAALGLAPLAGFAQARRPAADLDYSELKSRQAVETNGKIEVIEFFWYGCGACYALEPLLEKWVPKLPADAQYRRIPAVFNDAKWARDAGIFYAFEALGITAKVHRPFFDAIHRDRLRTDNSQALAEWLQRNNVDPKKFDAIRKSFGVQSKLRRAAQLSVAYGIAGTPTLAVHGRYTISVEQAGSWERMLAIADYLIGVARKGGQTSG